MSISIDIDDRIKRTLNNTNASSEWLTVPKTQMTYVRDFCPLIQEHEGMWIDHWVLNALRPDFGLEIEKKPTTITDSTFLTQEKKPTLLHSMTLHEFSSQN